MNDNHLDPPDYPEIPECCGEEMDCTDTGTVFCHKCGRKIEPQPDDHPDIPGEDPNIHPACTECGAENPNGCQLCTECATKPRRHGNPHHGCGHCDHLADLAYDAARESR